MESRPRRVGDQAMRPRQSYDVACGAWREILGMSKADKAKSKVKKMKGMAKEKVGQATHNEQAQKEGRSEQAEAQARQAGDKMGDAARDVKESAERKFTD